MIHVNQSTLQMPAWQNQLAHAIRDPKQLLSALNLPLCHLEGMEVAHQLFPLRVTESYLSRIEKSNILDPLLMQVLPTMGETADTYGYSADPVGDKAAEVLPGLLHKYKNRVLLTLTAACGIHCRYCFRRHYDYSASNATKHWLDNLAYIKKNTHINEIIFSGGDPLSLSDQRIRSMIKDISTLPHIKTLRIHTRQVIILPDRVDSSLLNWVNSSRLNIIFVIHVNHPNEIDSTVAQALSRLTSAGVILLNQSVLLRGINDSANTLTQLSEKLFANGVLPYYLHMLDKVRGAAHFEVKQTVAKQLIKDISSELPGYLVPRLVRDIPETPYKTSI